MGNACSSDEGTIVGPRNIEEDQNTGSGRDLASLLSVTDSRAP
eukprot:SAG11_NODE_23235_length_392_cov_1.529010_1_plen_42_part_10